MSNRFFITAVILMTLISAGVYTRAWSFTNPPRERGEERDNEPRGIERRLDAMAEVLELTDEQISAIRAVYAAEREKIKEMRGNFEGFRKEMDEAARIIPFDEAKVRAIATRHVDAKIEMSVQRARTQNAILAILTPDQRTLFEKVRPLLRGRHDHKGERRPFRENR